ncbi:MAG: hypothetical protein D3913_06915 [Candidatus Electrothrix sp. LOE1_4_5]|nr:hypothetical protein [Candidatus Electrothrix gigas]
MQQDKILFACRRNPSSAFLAQHLWKENLLSGIILESGREAKKRKIRKIRKNTKWWAWPMTLLDVGCLFIYQVIMSRKIAKFVQNEIGTVEFPDNVKCYYTDDINDDICLGLFETIQHCTLVVFGTSILKEKTINAVNGNIYNIHGGIVPKYRNVHSDIWAYINHDFGKIGTTIMHLDSGIDTGDIAAQDNIILDECLGIADIKIKNLQLSARLIVHVLVNKNSEMFRVQQDKTQQNFYPTPRAFQLMKLLLQTIFR